MGEYTAEPAFAKSEKNEERACPSCESLNKTRWYECMDKRQSRDWNIKKGKTLMFRASNAQGCQLRRRKSWQNQLLQLFLATGTQHELIRWGKAIHGMAASRVSMRRSRGSRQKKILRGGDVIFWEVDTGVDFHRGHHGPWWQLLGNKHYGRSSDLTADAYGRRQVTQRLQKTNFPLPYSQLRNIAKSGLKKNAHAPETLGESLRGLEGPLDDSEYQVRQTTA